jgi:hypothetical protein
VSTDALTFVAITPCRLVDTRGAGGGFNGNSPFAGPSIASGGTVTFPVQSASEATANTTPAPCGVIPSIAQAYSFNLTVLPHGVVGWVTLWPSGSPQPIVSTLNDYQGALIANAAIVPAGTPLGGVSVYNQGPAATDVVIDMNGFFAAPTDLNNNTAIGMGALASNIDGTYNTATGQGALASNTIGASNTASGAFALQNNIDGSGNTASGRFALLHNNGNSNTANGDSALEENTTGGNNTATGSGALVNNKTGNLNTASGSSALESNTFGSGNTADGESALFNNTTGSNNTVSGYQALGNNITGSSNIALGNGAGINAPIGNSNSVYIVSAGTGTDASGTIQIGTEGTQTGGTFIAGISGASVSGGVPVLVNSNGKLGTVLSSRRFKDQITDMGDKSGKLLQLRPVNYFYKPEYDDGSHLLQYGLIAEEVAKVYPEMVAYDRDGKVLTVKYQLLAPMLLNEVQKQAAQIHSLEERLDALEGLLAVAPQLH